MKKLVLLFTAIGFIISACSSSQQTTEQKPKEKEIYVFDDANVKNAKDSAAAVNEKKAEEIPPVQVTEVKKEIPVLKEMNFIVQLGAFSTKEKAEKFVADNKNLLNYEMSISFSEAVKLYVVQLVPGFATKEEAEKVRNKLWEVPVFKDAFIVTHEKK